MKTCTYCNQAKSADEFSSWRGQLRSRCKPCEADIRRTNRNPNWKKELEEHAALLLRGQQRCVSCTTVKDLSRFSVEACGKTRTTCMKCRGAQKMARYAKDPERYKQRQKEWLATERGKAYQSSYCSEYYQENKDVIAIKSSEFRADNIEAIRAYDRMRGQRPERKEHNRLNLEKHGHKYKESSKRWRAANPDAVKALRSKRRAAQKSVGGEYKASDIRAIYAEQGGLCGRKTEHGLLGCSKPLQGKYHIDHIKPIKLGGSNWPDNIQLLCPKCNLRKGCKLPSDWASVAATLRSKNIPCLN